MAKKEIDDNNLNNPNLDAENTESEEKGKKKRKKNEIPKTEEELYVETLSKQERKDYERRKRTLKRSQWVAEYWIIIILAVAVFIVFCVLMAINYFGISANDFFAVENIGEHFPTKGI